MTSYRKLVEVTIAKEKETLGNQKAVDIAKDVSGITLDDEGDVMSLTGDGKQILGELVRKYKDNGGDITTSLISREIEKNTENDLELPDILNSKSKAEGFASAL